jgi:hypothetical protein
MPSELAIDSESSSLSSAPDDEDFDFEPAKLTTTATTTASRGTATTRGALTRRVSVENNALKGRGRKRLRTQDTPAGKRPRQQIRGVYLDGVKVGAGVIGESPEKQRKRRKVSGDVKPSSPGASGEESKGETPPRSLQKKSGRKASHKIEERQDVETGAAPKKLKRKRKTKEEKEAEEMPLAMRTRGLKVLIGAHVSAAKG